MADREDLHRRLMLDHRAQGETLHAALDRADRAERRVRELEHALDLERRGPRLVPSR